MKPATGMIVDHKKVLNQLAELIQREEDCVIQIYSDPERAAAQKEKLEIARSKTGEKFIVLIIGAFSSGKSSMINAMIGEELLPTGFLPETAVLGELHYGEEKRITLYPKKGCWEGGDEPFDLKKTTSDEIERYVSLSADDAINAMEKNAMDSESTSKIDSKFEKMVIYWPLNILKDGVVLVDSPGINDPYSNDYIVNDYLPHADAIVYVMDSQKAYQGTDRAQLTTINNIGLKNIVTGYTFYDIVVRQSGRKPEKLEQLRNRLVSYMTGHTDLGKESIHFLDSLEGLQAKLDGNQEGLRHSGFEGFERYLGQYLVEGKGKDQVKNMASTIVKQADSMIKEVGNLNSAAAQDVDSLEKKIKDANAQLGIVRSNSFNTGRNYRNHLENYLPKAETMVREFVKSLPESIDLEGFEPETELPDGARKLWPFGENGAKKRAKAIQKECQNEITRRMNVAYRKWSNEKLGIYMKSAVEESAKAIRPDLNQIAKDLTDITDMVAGESHKGDGTVGNIAVGLAYAMITGDWFTSGMSAIYGKGAMARGIAFQAGAGVALGVMMAAGVAISLPLVAVAAIGASIAAILTDNNKKKVEKIKVQSVKDFRKAYASEEAAKDIDKMVDSVLKNVREYIDSACSDMDEALARDIKDTEDSIQQMINESKLGQDAKDRQIKARLEAAKKLEEIRENAIDICRKYNITDVVIS